MVSSPGIHHPNVTLRRPRRSRKSGTIRRKTRTKSMTSPSRSFNGTNLMLYYPNPPTVTERRKKTKRRRSTSPSKKPRKSKSPVKKRLSRRKMSRKMSKRKSRK